MSVVLIVKKNVFQINTNRTRNAASNPVLIETLDRLYTHYLYHRFPI